MSVKIRKKPLKDNRASLYLDIYDGQDRKYEFLGLQVFKKPASEIERQHNKQVLAVAESRRSQVELSLYSGSYEKPVKASKPKRGNDVASYLYDYAARYEKKNYRVFTATAKHFEKFAQGEEIGFASLTEKKCEDFYQYVYNTFHGTTVGGYFRAFRQMIRQACKDGHLDKNPVAELKVKLKPFREKDTLTMEEIQVLRDTDCRNINVKRAFLFACYTGLRLVDIQSLHYRDIQDGVLRIIQSKTQRKITIKLTPTALYYLQEGPAHEPCFRLPSSVHMLDLINHWVRMAKIKKHITFHCARHSFGTNLIKKGVDIRVIAKLLGHSDLKMVMRYTRVADETLYDAITKLEE